jgi:hypothetical protein
VGAYCAASACAGHHRAGRYARMGRCVVVCAHCALPASAHMCSRLCAVCAAAGAARLVAAAPAETQTWRGPCATAVIAAVIAVGLGRVGTWQPL